MAWGAGVAAVGLVTAFVLVPFGKRVSGREAAIEAQRVRIGRLASLVSRQQELQQAVGERNSELAAWGVRVSGGRSPALAAAALQSLVQGYARASRLSVTRLDVAGDVDSTSAAWPHLPVTVSASGDVYGLVEMLSRLHGGPLLIEVREMTVSPNAALRGDLLQVSLVLRSPWLPEAGQ